MPSGSTPTYDEQVQRLPTKSRGSGGLYIHGYLDARSVYAKRCVKLSDRENSGAASTQAAFRSKPALSVLGL